MKYFFLVGETGVGKSSVVNSIFGLPMASVDRFRRCTVAVSDYIFDGTSGEQLCVIDSPGLGENEEISVDLQYMELIRARLANIPILEALVLVARLDVGRSMASEKRMIGMIVGGLRRKYLKRPWLVLTHAANVQKEDDFEIANRRIAAIDNCYRESYERRFFRTFNGFRKIIRIDNKSRSWAPGAPSISDLLQV